MKKSLLFLASTILIAASSSVIAQEPAMPGGPPKLLMIVREEIKPGMMGAHGRHSADFVSLFSELNTPNHRIALVPVAGNENEVLYITPVNSYAELEEINQATDKQLGGVTGSLKARRDALDKEAPTMHAAMRDMWATYRPELSFNPSVDIRKMRYFVITTTRVRPGFDAAYVEYVQKVINIARQKAKVDNVHLAVFQVTSGAAAGTYLTFRPLKALSELDDPAGMRVRAAMSDDQKKDADKAVREMIMSAESSTYAFAPSMSYVDKDFVAGDPAFWNPKPAPMPRPRPRRP